MSVAPIGGMPTFPQLGEVGVRNTPAPSGFGELLSNSLHEISAMEQRADAMAVDIATGGSTKVHEMMIATTESALAVDLLVAVRDRALEAYNEIMRMQL